LQSFAVTILNEGLVFKVRARPAAYFGTSTLPRRDAPSAMARRGACTSPETEPVV
jgi:hypothetical protein